MKHLTKMCSLAFLLLIVTIFLRFYFYGTYHSEKSNILDDISNSVAVKLEYSADKENSPVLIDNNLTPAHNFASLAIRSSEGAPDGSWIYRFTYNPKEKVLNSEEILVLFGENSLSINGVLYIPEDGVDYKMILEWAENIYEYYITENL